MTGSWKKKAYPKDKGKLTVPFQFFIINLVIKRPGICLCELQDGLKCMLEVRRSVSVSNLHVSASPAKK